MLLCLTLTPSFEPLRELVGSPLFTSIILFKDTLATWTFRNVEAEALGMRMLDILRVPSHRSSFDEGVEASIATLDNEIARLLNEDVSHQSLEDLLSNFHRLEDAYSSFYRYGAFVEPVQAAAQSRLISTVKRLKEQREEKVDVVTESLYCLDSQSYVIDHLNQLLDVLELTRDRLSTSRLGNGVLEMPLLPVNAFLSSLGRADDSSSDLLDSYVASHSWIKNDYLLCRRLTVAEFLEEDLTHFGGTLADATEALALQLKEIERNRSEQWKRKTEMLESLTPSETRVLAIHDAIGGRLSDLRKKIVKRTNGCFFALLGQIAERIQVDLGSVLQLLPQELDTAVRAPERFRSRLIDRADSMLVYQADFSILDEESYDWPTGFTPMDGPSLAEGAIAVEETLAAISTRLDCLDDEGDVIEKLSGVVVYSAPGVAESSGLVKVVRNPRGADLDDGSILVASSTTPEFLPLMRKASAIVTDWGGQTSHAAIIARELRIPCVIGTKTGSYVLKTGDEVTIDWNSGDIIRQKRIGSAT
jgi:phosphohistidine swiveling domain-containing protein